MSNICCKCGTVFDSPFCPNCGTPAQSQSNQQLPTQNPLQKPYNDQNPLNQYITNPNIIHPTSKKKHGCLFWGLIVTGAIFFIFIFSIMISGCMYGIKEGYNEAKTRSDNTNMDNNGTANDETDSKITATVAPTTPPTPTINPYIKISSTDLISAYKGNQVKCKKLYDKHLLKVTGTVTNVGTDVLDQTYVCLGSDSEYTFVGIQCYAKNEDEVNKIAELKKETLLLLRERVIVAHCHLI